MAVDPVCGMTVDPRSVAGLGMQKAPTEWKQSDETARRTQT
jgi:YHS domain-containing protein